MLSNHQPNKEEHTHRSITTISLPLPFRLGSVNCYLIETDTGHVLIDTGTSSSRTELERALETAGCKPGNLTLIILTHGDFDHIGNAAYLRRTSGAKIAMHSDDSGMAERGDMFWNRESGSAIFRVIGRIFFRLSKSDRFEPDTCVEDGTDLSACGIDARVLAIPGHSKGSIGILTAAGDLFCGDLFENSGKPAPNSIMDNPTDCGVSIMKLSGLQIGTVYPGHGKPFSMESLIETHR